MNTPQEIGYSEKYLDKGHAKGCPTGWRLFGGAQVVSVVVDENDDAVSQGADDATALRKAVSEFRKEVAARA